MELYPPISVPERLSDFPQTSARTPAATPCADPLPLYSCTSSPISRSKKPFILCFTYSASG